MGGSEAQLDENYLRYVTLLSKIKNETSAGVLSALSSGVIPLPHQLHVLERALETRNIRYILADEVGLGKTIEAGMIIKELKARGLITRILVVCPTGLVSQWSVEMQEKFHEKFQVILPSDFDTIRRLTDNDDVYGQFDQVISPMDSIKPVEKHAGWSDERVEKYNQERIEAIINSGWDLIIIDEAHRVAGSSSDVARYKLGYLLSQASPYLLLLTATPHNGKTEPFLRLVRLLDEQAFPNYKSIVKEQVAPYLIRSEKREAIDNNGNLLFKKRYTHLVELHWDERHSLQRQLYELVSSYVSKTYDKARRNRKKNMCLIFLMIIMQRMVTSSTAAVRQSLERRLRVLLEEETRVNTMSESDWDERDIEDGDADAMEAMSLDCNAEIEELKMIISVAKQAEFQHTKADLNWMDKNARSTIEMNDPASRPEIASKRDNMDDYDTIFVGFPIWWYVAPVIINTFLESYDLTGKTIIPFATSGGSGMGKTNEKLASSCKGAKLLESRVLNKPFSTLPEDLQERIYFEFGSSEDHYKYRDAVMNAYPHGNYPVFEGYNHMQFQIRDPEGFATMLRSVMEENHMPELPFLKERG